jgi:hypothetical protein
MIINIVKFIISFTLAILLFEIFTHIIKEIAQGI